MPDGKQRAGQRRHWREIFHRQRHGSLSSENLHRAMLAFAAQVFLTTP